MLMPSLWMVSMGLKGLAVGRLEFVAQEAQRLASSVGTVVDLIGVGALKSQPAVGQREELILADVFYGELSGLGQPPRVQSELAAGEEPEHILRHVERTRGAEWYASSRVAARVQGLPEVDWHANVLGVGAQASVTFQIYSYF